MKFNRNEFTTHFALFTVALIYSGNFSIAQWAMPKYIDAFGFIALRVFCGAFIFFLIYRLFLYEPIKEKKHYFQLAVAGFFGIALNMMAFFKGLSLTSPINASVLMLFAPLFVVIFGAIKKKKLGYKLSLGVAMAFVSAAFLVGINKMEIGGSGMYGDLLVILNACSYGFYLVYISDLLKIYKATTITAYIFLFGLLYVLPIGGPELIKAKWSMMDLKAYISVVYVVVAVTIMAYFLNSWGIQRSNSALVGTYVYLQPLLATVIAIVLGQDVLTIEKTIFAALIVAGVYLVNSSKQ